MLNNLDVLYTLIFTLDSILLLNDKSPSIPILNALMRFVLIGYSFQYQLKIRANDLKPLKIDQFVRSQNHFGCFGFFDHKLKFIKI